MAKKIIVTSNKRHLMEFKRYGHDTSKLILIFRRVVFKRASMSLLLI